MRIFAFEGPDEVYATQSLDAAGGFFEAIDVENEEYVFFGDDGTVIMSELQGGRVVLIPKGDKRPGELRQRLRTVLAHPRMAMDPVLAEDPAMLADLLIARNQARRSP
jgi:hypothetical protein